LSSPWGRCCEGRLRLLRLPRTSQRSLNVLPTAASTSWGRSLITIRSCCESWGSWKIGVTMT
jgi:hypothetical protein